MTSLRNSLAAVFLGIEKFSPKSFTGACTDSTSHFNVRKVWTNSMTAIFWDDILRVRNTLQTVLIVIIRRGGAGGVSNIIIFENRLMTFFKKSLIFSRIINVLYVLQDSMPLKYYKVMIQSPQCATFLSQMPFLQVRVPHFIIHSYIRVNNNRQHSCLFQTHFQLMLVTWKWKLETIQCGIMRCSHL